MLCPLDAGGTESCNYFCRGIAVMWMSACTTGNLLEMMSPTVDLCRS